MVRRNWQNPEPRTLNPLRRPGSVLVLVVALLVLMALIATAYISSARVDRYNARQSKTRFQLNLDGVVESEVHDLTNSLYPNGQYRAESLPTIPSHFQQYR